MAYIDKKSAIDALKAIRYGLWEIDIPSPTVPEYVEHHEQIKNMMEITDGWIKKLEEQPTADVVERKDIEAELDAAYKHGYSDCFSERKKGKWIKESLVPTNYPYKCSACKKYSRAMYDFCPNCGARMDGKETEDGRDTE